MNLNRSGFVIRTAYPFGMEIPERTSLCLLFWRFVFCGIMLVLWNAIKAFGLALAYTANAFFFIPMLFFGLKPVIHEAHAWSDGDQSPFVLYERWPRVGGQRVIPAAVILAFIVGLKIGSSLMGVGISNPGYWVSVGATFLIGAKYTAIIAAGVLAFILGDRARRSETMQFMKAWLKAKKERVCPIVEITNLTPAGQ